MTTIKELEDKCRKNGIKLTHQRIEIFKEIMAARDHPSVERIYRRLKKKMPVISIDTIYRTLTIFERLGLITRVYTGEPITRFDPRTDLHHHIICEQCGDIIDFDWPAFDSLTLPSEIETIVRVKRKQIQLYGICIKCNKGG